jgi:predicted molibdopterin-dependent oxidoreductase YjgC
VNHGGSLRLPVDHGIERGPAVTVLVEGRPVGAFLGETVATVLLAEGHVALRTTVQGQPRGVFCGMGVCFDCLVVVDGKPNTRACMTFVEEGMRIARQAGLEAMPDATQLPG